jgi:hypothetical protein
VTQAPTSLVATPQGLVATSLTATLTRSFDRAPLTGQTVTFSVGQAKVCTAQTNANGVATCRVLVISLGGSYTATFAGSIDYLGTTARADL